MFLNNVFVLTGRLLHILPRPIGFFMFRLSGLVFYLVASKRRREVLKNIRVTFSRQKSPFVLRQICKRFFIEISYIMFETARLGGVSQKYIKKHVRIRNAKSKEGIDKGILSGIHMGNWEWANLRMAQDVGKYAIFAREQPRNEWDRILNFHRRRLGLEIMPDVSFNLKKMVEHIKKGYFLGFVVDHGVSKNNPQISFFGRNVPYPVGAVKISMKYDLPILLSSIHRTRGSYHTLGIEKIFRPSDYKDTQTYLEDINNSVEEIVKKYPHHYNWFFKRYKYSDQRWVLCLSDGKAGHKKQLENLCSIFKNSSYEIVPRFVDIKFKGTLRSVVFKIAVFLLFRICPQVLLYIARWSLEKEVFDEIFNFGSDMVVSCSSGASFVNLVVSYEDFSKNLHVLRPSFLPLSWFNRVFIPYHDGISARNVFNFEGSLSFVSPETMVGCAEKLKNELGIKDRPEAKKISLFIGGKTKNVHFDEEVLKNVITRLKEFSARKGVRLYVTTSRRTSGSVELFLEDNFKDFDNTDALVIASKKNYPFVVDGFLGLSDFVIVTADSISMIWEAVSSGKPVFIMEFPYSAGYGKLKRFIERLYDKGWAKPLPVDLNRIFQWSPKEVQSYRKEVESYLTVIVE